MVYFPLLGMFTKGYTQKVRGYPPNIPANDQCCGGKTEHLELYIIDETNESLHVAIGLVSFVDLWKTNQLRVTISNR